MPTSAPQFLDPEAALRLLQDEEPAFHGPQGSDPECWRIDYDVLDWLAASGLADGRSLETGCGYSTVLFAALGSRHTVISPASAEHERVRDWCRARGISTGSLEFVAQPSDRALPEWQGAELDLVLIDGCHAFPWPFLDWFYTARWLRVGGRLIVDDTHLRTGAILRDFLAAEEGRWSLMEEFAKSAVFEKVSDQVLDDIWWAQQPWGARPLSRRQRRWRLRRSAVRRALGRSGA